MTDLLGRLKTWLIPRHGPGSPRSTRVSGLLLVLLSACRSQAPSDPNPPPEDNPPPATGNSVASVTVAPSSLQLLLGQSASLTATARDSSNQPLPEVVFTWSSGDINVVAVSEAGLVTAAYPGRACIVATAQGTTGTALASVESPAFVSVDAGNWHTCAVTTEGSAYCWGRGGPWLGSGADYTERDGTKPLAVHGGIVFASVTAGFDHTCGLTAAGAAYCWGSNESGQVGDGTTQIRQVPTAVSGGHAFTTLSAGRDHTCGVTDAGVAYCWGRNTYGQLGDGTTTARNTPELVSGDLAFTMVSAGADHTCGVSSAGAGYCWGRDLLGELGDGTADPYRAIPAAVGGGLTFTVTTAGEDHSCGVDTAGVAYCWGSGLLGRLGIGISGAGVWYLPFPRYPVLVTDGIMFTAVAAGTSHTCALSGDGRAFCWGGNGVGQLGDESTTDRLRPVTVIGGHAFTEITAGRSHTCALATSGTAHCWGFNESGQLGDGTTTSRLTPTEVRFTAPEGTPVRCPVPPASPLVPRRR